METIEGVAFEKPFPHLIIKNFYNPEELELIWEELKFYTKPGKLLEAKDFGGVEEDKEKTKGTNSHALQLDTVYGGKFRNLSNILTVNRKVFDSELLDAFSNIDDCCCIAKDSNYDISKIRYYHNGEYYKPHTDRPFHFLAFSYFYKEPKKFIGGELKFPKYHYEYSCDNNSIIILPGWVEHEVTEVKIKDSDYYDGWGRYCISNFFGSKSR